MQKERDRFSFLAIGQIETDDEKLDSLVRSVGHGGEDYQI